MDKTLRAVILRNLGWDYTPSKEDMEFCDCSNHGEFMDCLCIKHQWEKDNEYAEKLIAEILELLPEEELHTHNSIPCYVGEEDEGCWTCRENRLIRKIKERFGV